MGRIKFSVILREIPELVQGAQCGGACTMLNFYHHDRHVIGKNSHLSKRFVPENYAVNNGFRQGSHPSGMDPGAAFIRPSLR